MAAENNESLDFRELRGVFTFTDHPVDDQVLRTQILATSPHPGYSPQISSLVPKQVSGIGMDKSGTLKLSYSQNYIGDTQKDPDIFGDETQKDPEDSLEETQRDPDLLVDETQKDPPDLVDETQRDPDIWANGTLHNRNNSPWNDIPTTAHRHTSVGLESQEGRNYFDESRRFGSPDKTQQTPAKSIAPLSGLTSAMKGTIPMGLTQIFNNTQDSPLQPTKTARTIPLRCSTSPQRSSPTMNKPIFPPRAPSAGPHKTPSPPPDDAYYSIARSQEERSNRLGKARKKQDGLREKNIDDEELSISFDDEVVNRKPRKAQPAMRKNDDEVQKLYESMKASRAAKVEKIEKNAKTRKQKPERLEKSEKAGKADQARRKNPNPSFEQALQSITRESAKGDNANVERREDRGKEKQQTASQKKAEDRARVIAEKRMRNRNFPPPTGDDTTTDDDSQPLPPAIHQPALESNKKTGRYSSIQSGEPQIEISKSATGRKPPTPFGPQDWDSIHEVPRPRSDRHSSVFMRKRTLTSSSNLPDAPLDEQSVAPPPKPRAAKSSIKNMPPFNIPTIPPLLKERSTFSPVLLENIYQGSSSLPMPPGMGPYEELPLTSSPPPILLMGDAATTQVERSPPPDEGLVEVSASPSQLCTPQLHKKVCLNQGSIIPETSPIVAEAMSTPIRRSGSRIQDEILEYNEEATDVDETPVPSPMKHISPNKKKRTSMHIDQAKHGEDFIPSSLPQENRMPATDEEGDINMDEIRQRSGEAPHISEPEAESGSSTPSFNPRKKRKTEKPLATTQTTDRKENRRQAKSENSKPVLQNTGSVKSKIMTPTMENVKPSKVHSLNKATTPSLPTLTLNAAPQDEVETVVNQAVAPDPETTNSNALQRVFALFRDKDMHYHPGTVIPSPNVARSHLKIMFDDGTEVLTDKGHVRRLILRVGDVIKCSLGSMKPKYWVVIGFPDSPPEIDTSTPNWESTLVDTNGHRTVFLKEKKKGAKLGTVAAALMAITEDDIGEGTIGDVVEVPITKLYVVKSLWSQFKERVYNLESLSPDEANPMNRVSFVQPDTPSSKDRRASPMFSIPKPAFSSVQPGVSVKKPGVLGRIDGMFSGMVFALSFGNNEIEKKSITTKILAHGGRILDSGFDEVFKSVGGPQLKYVSATTSMISNISETEKDVDSVEGDSLCATDFGLQPLAGADTIGFACVIADKFSRRFKFLQALALGIPCLASKWVEDCIKSNVVVEWDIYLLPAGESAYLSGAIRSRILPSFSAATTKFMTIIDQRKRLLEGCSVLIVMGKGKLAERRNQLRWLLCAMGARAVRGVISVDEANGVLRGAPGTAGNVGEGTGEGIVRVKWDLLCLDSTSGSTRGTGKEKLWLGAPKGLGPRIVDDEWLIQSLILGKLLDET